MEENKLRSSVEQLVLSTTKSNVVLELATSMGKSKLALEWLDKFFQNTQNIKVLLVIPRNVLIDNWKAEFSKWHYERMLANTTFVTYKSLPKKAGKWNFCIFDECHHLSERCQEALQSFSIEHCIFLSATIKKEHKYFINEYCKYNVQWVSINAKKAIDESVLPDPKILLLPLQLNKENTEKYLYYPKKQWSKMKAIKKVPYKDRWSWKKSKIPYALVCTQQQYYSELSGIIEWYKRKNFNPVMKNLWLHKCGERLQWLASLKIPKVMEILHLTRKQRSITFCANIDDTTILDIPSVNSKVGTWNLIKFNSKEIKQISCVGMLDEGLNPVDCQIGIFNMLNSSSRLQTQRIGRILRHKKPLIIIPYFKDTRDEEIVNGIKEEYKDMTYTIDNVEQIKDYL